MTDTFLDLFSVEKPILAMIHLKGENDEDIYRRMKRELDIYFRQQVDGIILENYFGEFRHLEKALEYVRSLSDNRTPIGVNCLNCDAMGFELAHKYDADFLQLDSVVGHVKPRDEDTLRAFFELYRKRYPVKILGGVRFKYQPVLSQNTVEEDLKIAKTRCDAVCVTQEYTGQETSLEKIKTFRQGLGEFPLIIGAGVTPETFEKQWEYADGAIVGSYFKEGHKDIGEVCEKNVADMMSAVRKWREKQ